MKAEIICDLPIGEYHASDYISSTKLGDLHPCALNFKRRHIDKVVPKKEGDHFDFGNAAHWLILEGEAAYNERVVVHPETYLAPASRKKDAPMIDKPWNWNATTCQEWAEGCAGRVILSKNDCATIDRLHAAVAGNPVAAALLTGGRPEVTFRKHLGLFGVQCRLDYWHHDGVDLPGIGRIADPVIVDFKTCDTIERFEKDFFDLSYHMRAEFYRLVVREVLAEMAEVPADEIARPLFFFVVAEKSEPHRCEVFEPDVRSLDIGQREVAAALATLAKCYRTGEWPGSRAGVVPIGLKTWQEKRSEERTEAAMERKVA